MGEPHEDNVEQAPTGPPGIPPMRPVYAQDAKDGGGLGPWPGRLLQVIVFVGVVVVYQFVRDALGFWLAIVVAAAIAALAAAVNAVVARLRSTRRKLISR